MKITWGSVAGATEYRVFRKVPGGSYSYVSTGDNNSYIDTDTKPGVVYNYSVRAYSEKAVSGYEKKGITGVFLKNSPIVNITEDHKKGIIINYSPVEGADGYKIYRRKADEGNWNTLAYTTSTSYTDTSSVSGIKYEYVVRAYKEYDGVKYLGYWSSSDKATATGVGKIYVIVLDPGHDAAHSGATAINGSNEMELNLKIALACKAELEKYEGVIVYMTHDTLECPFPGADSKQCLDKRNAWAKSLGCDYYISLHNNAGGGSSAQGAEVYYPNTNYRAEYSALGRTMASNILDELTDLGLYYRGLYTRTDDEREYIYPDGSSADYYNVIRNAKLNGFVGLIVEHAFVDNNDFYSFLSTDAKLAALGIADARGIAKTLGSTKK